MFIGFGSEKIRKTKEQEVLNKADDASGLSDTSATETATDTTKTV